MQSSSELQQEIRLELSNMLSEVTAQVTALLKFPSLITSCFEGWSHWVSAASWVCWTQGSAFSSRGFLHEGFALQMLSTAPEKVSGDTPGVGDP